MTLQHISILGPADLIEDLSAEFKKQNFDSGEPEPADALTDAANSPLGPDEIQAALHFLSVSFDAANHALQFAVTLTAVLKANWATTKVSLINPRTGKEVTQVDSESNPAVIAEKLEK